MAKKLSKDDVKKWHTRLKLSKRWREPYEKKWDRYQGYFQNIFFDHSDGNDQIAVNLVFPMVKVIIPSIYSRNPDVLVKPRQGQQFMLNSEAMYHYLRYQVKEMGLKDEVKLSLLDALIFGHGWVKQGFETEFEGETDELDKTSVFEQVKEVLQNMAGYDNTDYEKVYAIRPNEKVVAERPWALRVSPRDMFVPAYSKNLKTLPWIAERILTHLDDVKANPRYSNTKDLKPSSGVKELLKSLNTPQGMNYVEDSECEYVILYEISDARSGCVYTIAEDNDLPLEVKENMYGFLDTRFPYSMLRFNEIPDEFYPMSDVESWEPQQLELNNVRTQMSVHRKRFNRRYVTKRDAFTPEDLEDLKSGEDGTIVQTDEDNLQNAIQPIQDAPLHQEVYSVEQGIKGDITEISGITGYQRGTTSEGARTATEASIVESQSRSRVDERLDVVNQFVLQIIVNTAKIAQKYMSIDEVYPILGDDLISGWLEMSSEDIKGEFIYDIVYGSSLPINKEVDRQQFLQLYEMASQDPYFNPITLREELLRKFDQRDIQRFLATPPDPMGAGEEGLPPADMGDGSVSGAPPPPIPISPLPPAAGQGVTSPASIRASIARSIGMRQPGGIGGI